MRKIPLLLAMLTLLGCGSVSDPPPEDPPPLFWAIEHDGVLQGVAGRYDTWSEGENDTFITKWIFPREPFFRSCFIEYRREAGIMTRYDWTIDGNDALRGRIMPETRGDFAWLATGWGDLEFRRNLSPAETPPIPVDPRSPFSFELLGAAWNKAGRPESLDLTILKIGDPRKIADPVEATLFHEGQLDGGGFPVEGFHLLAGEEALHFKLFSQDFPCLWASLAWGVTLQYLGENPLNIDPFSPDYPFHNGYVNEVFEIAGVFGAVRGQASIPEGEGPFPGILMISSGGKADRNQGALFGFLAHELARAGWFVARYDKPGLHDSEGPLFELGLDERRQHLDAAWDSLSADARVDPQRLVLLGYGEGAALAMEAATRLDATALVALSPWLNRPEELADIPEAIDGVFTLLGLDCFGGKHLDRASFDPAVYLPALDLPLLLCAAGLDTRNPLEDVLEQLEFIEQGSADLSYLEYPALSAAYNATIPQQVPDVEFTQDLLAWLAATIR